MKLFGIVPILILGNLCFTIKYAIAQSPTYTFTSFTTESGLLNDRVLSLLKDSRGFLWTITYDGVQCFDGKQFNLFPTVGALEQKASSSPFGMAEDSDHHILFAFKDAIEILDPVSQKIYEADLRNAVNWNNPLNDLFVDRQKNIWIGCTKTITEFDPHFHLKQQWVIDSFHLPPPKTVFNPFIFCFEDHSGNIWFEINNFPCMMNPQTGEVNSVMNNPHHRKIFSLYENRLYQDNNDRIWFIKGHQLIRSDPRDDKINFYSKLDSAANWKIYCSPTGEIFLFADDESFYTVDPLTGGLSSLKIEAPKLFGTTISDIACLIEDNNSQVWIASNLGLIRGTPSLASHHFLNGFEGTRDQSGRPRDVSDVLLLKDYLFVLTANGAVRINKKTHQEEQFRFNSNSNFKNHFSECGQLDSGTILISSWKGTYQCKINEKKFSLTALSFQHPAIIDSFAFFFQRDLHNNLWFGLSNNHGVVRWNLPKNIFTHYSQNDTGEKYIPLRHFSSAVEDENGFFWMGYNKGGLTSFNYATQRFTDPPVTNPHEITNEVCHSIVNDHHGHLWISGSYGLIEILINNKSYHRYTLPDGVPSNVIYEMVMDKKEKLWMLTPVGLSCFNITSNQFFNFTKKDLLTREDPVQLLYDSSENIIYFTSEHEIHFFYPDSVPLSNKVLCPSITSFTVNGNRFDMENGNEARLSPGENSFAFNYCAPNLVNAQSNVYEYRLSGYDQQWVKAGNREYVNYTNLPAGDYVFKLRASDDGVLWNEMTYPVTIRISQYFYKSIWFIVLITVLSVVLIAILIYFRYRIKLQRILYGQSIRNKIARDLHDDVSSSLGSISLYSEVAKQRVQKDFPQVLEYFEKIGEDSRDIIESMSDIVWMINPKNDSMEILMLRMENFATQVLQSKNIVLHFNADEKIRAIKLPMEYRRNLYLIFKEAISNSVKYSGCKNVRVKIEEPAGTIHLVVSDDGKGFDASHNYAGNGLHNFKTRAEEMNGTIAIDSIPGSGTTIHLQFKVT